MTFKLSVIAALLLALPASAAPWVDTTDNYLRQSLQTLAHAGVITGPVNTYPLMWNNIIADLARAKAQRTPELRFALAHVRSAIRANKQGYISGVKLKASSDPSLFQSFGENYFETASVSVFDEYVGDDWAGKFDDLNDICNVLYLERTQQISTTDIKNNLANTRAAILSPQTV